MTPAATRRLVPVIECTEVPAGATVPVTVEGRRLLVTTTEDGWWALEAECSHAGAPLDEARRAGCLLVCPWHEAVFDARTGQALRGPARRGLRTYPTLVQDGTVLVELP
jgi:nitrite reductase/ring-hydroxylating ferredoxin subunit